MTLISIWFDAIDIKNENKWNWLAITDQVRFQLTVDIKNENKWNWLSITDQVRFQLTVCLVIFSKIYEYICILSL